VIEANTVLILGAGASQRFGFPLGSQMVNDVVNGLIEPNETDLGKLLLDCHPQFSPRHFRDFATRLRDSHRDSVDEDCLKFLECHRVLI
jgi:hypothetical protein